MFRSRSLAVKGLYDDAQWVRASADIRRLLETRGGRVEVDGLEHVQNLSAPVVFVGNHMSTAETQLLPGIIEPFRHFTFVVKQSLMTGPVFGPVMRSRNPIAVTQKDPRRDMEKVMEEGCRLLKSGTSVFIFPEGARTDVFVAENFNSLGIKLARRAGVRIVPVALKTDFWGNGRYIRPFGKINVQKTARFKFGPARDVVGNGKETHAQIVDFVSGHLKEWGRVERGLGLQASGVETPATAKTTFVEAVR
ncbi:MAG: 1-acyl-sn-glycerol-3-phosphate acyltransferase [Spirochaetia bacterium]|nr:1-acyl-sn-glycerol-3-phosphate acyltransferase [Spirochaetia bacterium]